MKVLKAKKINYFQGGLIKIFNNDKINFKIKEVYAVEIRGKHQRYWRQHINCNKILFCIEGKFTIEIIKKNKKIKKIISKNNYIKIPKKTIFRFKSTTVNRNLMIVLSDILNKKLISRKDFTY